MKIRLKVEDKVMTATLIDSKTTRAFVSLLPLTLTMNDLFRREKFAHLPRPISEEGKRTHTYEVGQVVYWSPGRDVAIFYRNDGEKITNPGIIVIGFPEQLMHAKEKGEASMKDEFDETSSPELTVDEQALIKEMPTLTDVGLTRRTFLQQTIAGSADCLPLTCWRMRKR